MVDVGRTRRHPVTSPAPRQVGRVLLLDEDDRLLLLSGRDPRDPATPPWWFTPGGGAEEDETTEQAALRELEEETGLRLSSLGPVVLERRTAFEFDGVFYDQDERYYLARCRHFEPDGARRTDLEREVLLGDRWWSLEELSTTRETVFPPGLSEVLGGLLADEGPTGAAG